MSYSVAVALWPLTVRRIFMRVWFELDCGNQAMAWVGKQAARASSALASRCGAPCCKGGQGANRRVVIRCIFADSCRTE
ncbi:hypothetical protein CBM2599_B50955 [Cupriavidus taiwanensis]|nr:hypothetical protein CBM2599_B50955 [Cupriavidus taiwanensis]